MIIGIFFLAAIMIYVIEVKIGSSEGVYQPEIGFCPHFANPSKLFLKQFFFVLLPLVALFCLCAFTYLL